MSGDDRVRSELDILLVDWYQKYYRMALRRVRNEADAADLVQESMLVALSQYKQFRGDSLLSSWAYGIAKNRVREHMSRVLPRQELQVDVESVAESSEQSSGGGKDPLQLLLVREAARDVMAVFATLPPDMQEALEWAALDEGKSLGLAKQLNLSHGTIKSRISRGRALLRQRLASVELDRTTGNERYEKQEHE